MPQRQLDNALAQLVRAELIFRRGTPPDAEYTFKHALVQDAAYGTLLRSRRQQIHARIATTLERQFPEIVAAQPALMAQHCAEAGLTEKAVGYWLQAGQQAVARSAMAEAVAQLQKGLDQLASLPDNPWRQQQELDLQIALGPALAATKGYSAPDVGETIARARVLSEQLDRSDYLVPLLYGQWAFRLVRAEHRLALSYADQMEQVGETRNDVAALLLGHWMHGLTRLFLGEFVAARALFEQCDGLSDPAHRAVYAALSEQDPHPAMLVHLATALAFLGYLDQARSRVNEALSEARRLGHAHTLVLVLTWACLLEWVAKLPSEAQQHAEEAAALSKEHGFLLWLGFGLLYRGWSLTALEKPEEGLTLLTKGLSMVRATGAGVFTSSGGVAAVPENGSHRPAYRWGSPRLQQSAHYHSLFRRPSASAYPDRG
jgi:tetratricopeptide (TPR) repeat protein